MYLAAVKLIVSTIERVEIRSMKTLEVTLKDRNSIFDLFVLSYTPS
jgi:hypothetical protein